MQGGGNVALSWIDDPESARLRVDHAPFGRCEIVTWEAFEQRSHDRRLPSMAGTFERSGGTLVFTPRFLFVEGVRYALLVDGQLAGSLVRPVTKPPARTRVAGIFPTGGIVPVNLLRLYIQFSATMSEGCARKAVAVSTIDGQTLPDVLLDMEHELWDRARTRLTVFLDPGRIKRGLVPNLDGGYPLIAGRPIVIHVDQRFRDAQSRPIDEPFARRYDVGSALTTRVNPAQWVVSRPLAGSSQALQISFDRVLDRALLAQCLGVRDAAGEIVDGDVHIAAGERSWSFRPKRAWSGPCAITVDTRLEDVAGNSVLRVFDRDLTRQEDDPAGEHRMELLPIELT